MNTNINNEVNTVVRSSKVKDVLESLHMEMANEENHIFERFAYCCARYFYMWDQLNFYYKTYYKNEIIKRYLDGDKLLLSKFLREYTRINNLDWQYMDRTFQISQMESHCFKGVAAKQFNALLYLLYKSLNPDFVEMMDQCHIIVGTVFGGNYYIHDYTSALNDIRSNVTKIRDKINGLFHKRRHRKFELKYKIDGKYIIQAYFNATLWFLKNSHYNNITDTKTRMNKTYGKFCKIFPNKADIETITTYMESILDKILGHTTMYTTYMERNYESPLSDEKYTMLGFNDSEYSSLRPVRKLYKRFSSVIVCDVIKTYGDELFTPYSNSALNEKLTRTYKVIVPLSTINGEDIHYEIPMINSESVFNTNTTIEIPFDTTTDDENITEDNINYDEDIPEVSSGLYFFTNKYINLSEIVENVKYKLQITTTERTNNEIIGIIKVELNHDTDTYKVISHNIELSDDTAYRLFRHYATNEKELELNIDGIGIFKNGEFVREYKI